MDNAQLGNSELGNFQLGDGGSSTPPDFEVTVENTLTASGTLATNVQKNLTLTNTLTVAQDIFLPTIFVVSLANTLTASQTIANNKVISRNITNTSDVSHLVFVNSPRVLSVSSQAYLVQTINGVNATFVVSVTNSLSAYQIINARQGIYTVSITNTLSASQAIIIRDRIVIVTIENTLTVRQRINMAYPIFLMNTLTVAQTIASHKELVRNVVQIVSVSNIYTPSKDITRNLADHLQISNIYSKAGSVWSRNLSDFLVLTDVFRTSILVDESGYTPTYPAGPGVPPVVIPKHPVSTGTPLLSRNKTTIESPVGTIILPAPELGDSFSPKVTVNVKKTVTGKIYTYVKTNLNDKFIFSWVLGLYKALELKAYIDANVNDSNFYKNYYTLYLWNGEIWKAKIISVEIPLTFESVWQNSGNNNAELEKVTVSIQFEGSKIL